MIYQRAIGALTLSLLFAACGGAPAAPSGAEDETRQLATATRAALADASDAAEAYGLAHLGHLLDLNMRRLERHGLDVPESVSMKVRSTHTSFCITVVNEALPSIHPWARASLDSRDAGPSSADGCEDQ